MILRRKNFVSQARNEKLRRGTLRCFRKFRVSKIFMHKKGYHYFPLKFFCLTAPKNIVGEYFNVLRKFGLSKSFMDKRGGGEGVSRFSVLIIKLKNLGKGWDLNPYLPVKNPVVLPTVPWEPLEWNFRQKSAK